MPTEETPEWNDCWKALPYRDYTGRRVWYPFKTQRRRVIRDGREVTEYREREETWEEAMERMPW